MPFDEILPVPQIFGDPDILLQILERGVANCVADVLRRVTGPDDWTEPAGRLPLARLRAHRAFLRSLHAEPFDAGVINDGHRITSAAGLGAVDARRQHVTLLGHPYGVADLWLVREHDFEAVVLVLILNPFLSRGRRRGHHRHDAREHESGYAHDVPHLKSNVVFNTLLSMPLVSVARTCRSQRLPVAGAPACSCSVRGFGMLARIVPLSNVPRTIPASGCPGTQASRNHTFGVPPNVPP